MKYRIKTYRDAYLAALEGKTLDEKKTITRRFLALLTRERALGRAGELFRAIRRTHLKKLGRKEVILESAAPLTREAKREIEHALGKNISTIESVRPELLAGLKITINDETRIDASGKRLVDTMFTR